MAENPRSYLERKIKELQGVEKGPDGFFVNGREFARWAGSLFRVRVSDPCMAKIGSALKSDPRATFPGEAPGWVDLQVDSEVDVELVFVYIRYAWRFASSSG